MVSLLTAIKCQLRTPMVSPLTTIKCQLFHHPNDELKNKKKKKAAKSSNPYLQVLIHGYHVRMHTVQFLCHDLYRLARCSLF